MKIEEVSLNIPVHPRLHSPLKYLRDPHLVDSDVSVH